VQSIRDKETLLANDSERDLRILGGKTYATRGVRSVAILPLIVSEEAVGALVLFAREKDFFQDEEIKLLTDLTGNISFALDSIERKKVTTHALTLRLDWANA
jgi:GAF domain-containing protein